MNYTVTTHFPYPKYEKIKDYWELNKNCLQG